MRVKICGTTNGEDALVAAEAGADALGFVFWEGSPRRVALEQAAEIIQTLPPFISKVGVFVNPTKEKVRQVIDRCGLDTLQFHGDEPPEFCRQFGLKVIRAFRMQDAESLRLLAAYPTEGWLLDSFVPGQPGGTGARFNWDLAIEAKKFGRPIILAGGLTPANVAEAVRQVRPFAVDVASGVELAPGKKDPAKVRAFIAAARHAL